MKRIALLAAFVALVGVGRASGASVVNVTYTADNVTEAVAVQDGVTVTYTPIFPSGNSANWKLSDTMSLTLDYGHTYQVIFRVFNDTNPIWVPATNPAGFLAEIVGDVTGPKLTSSAWQYAIDTGTTPTDFNVLTWSNVTDWAWQGTSANNGGDNAWTGGNGGQPITGISTDAKWVWGPHNGADLGPGLYPAENFLWIRTQIAPIPEPSTLILLTMGALGLLAYRRRRTA